MIKLGGNLVLASLLAAVTLGVSESVHAQEPWPSRVIRIVVPAPPGSATDLLARILSEKLPAVLGQPVIVDNKPGAATNIGTEYVARQPPDGHTMLLTQNTLATNVSFYKKLPFDPIKDFEPVSLIATTPLVMAVNSESKVKSIRDLVELAKTRKLTYSSAGIGSPHHLAVVLFTSAAGLDMIHVPYKGSSPAALALISKEVDVAVSAVGAMRPHIISGRLRPLGVTEEKRSSLLPDVPPIADAVPGVTLDIWLGVLLPAGTPRAIVERLNAEVNTIMRDQQTTKARLAAAGIEAVGTTPERFAQVLKADIVKYQKIVKDANIPPE